MKLVYVHEGYETTVGKNSRKKLKNCRYFSGLYPDGSKFWEEVYDYLAETYNLKQVQQIYFSGDGARWIQEGVKFIPNTIFVLDRFHMVKYVKKACIGMTTGPSILLDWIEKDYKSYVEAFFTSRLSDPTLSVNQQKEIKKAKSYLLGHWKAIQRQKDKNYIGCSAEGHVSHVLSSRLSSRPLGWSKTGANNIAKIRVFLKNKGNLTVHLEMKTKEIQRKRAIYRLDKRVTNSNKVFNPYFLAKFPLLENGLITGTRNRVAKAIK